MTGPHTIEQHKTLERLAGSIALKGWRDFEVSLESDEFRVERHDARAACTVSLSPDESTFHAHFAFATTSVGAFCFTIGQQAAHKTDSKNFRDVDQAAEWLLESLQSAA